MGMVNYEKVLVFVQFVELVQGGNYQHDPSIESIRETLQKGKTPDTLKTQKKLFNLWETGMVDGVICSIRSDFSISAEVKSFNTFLVSLARKFRGMGKIPTLKMYDSASIADVTSELKEDFAESFVGAYDKALSKVLPFVVFKTIERKIEDEFWTNFELGEEASML